MKEHECSETIRLLRIEKLIDGNGTIGLVKQVEQHKIKIENMEESLESMAVSLSALAKNQLEMDITERLKVARDTLKIEQAEKRMRYLTIISIVFGITIPLTALIISLT